MISLAVPNLSGNEKKYLNECIDSTFVSSVGPFVNKFEELVSIKSGAKYSVATSAGTTALHVSLIAVGVKTDELVIIPAFTFIATANAVSHCGARPWCMDINKDTWTLDPKILAKELKDNTEIIDGKVIHKKSKKRVAAIMPVYTLGNVADMDEINKIASMYKLPVVADAAAAIGAKYKGQDIGKLADVTCFSFNGNKTITCGGGGMAVSNNKELIGKIRHLSTTARVSKEYDHDMVGYNYRMTNIQAAVGCAQIERLDEFVAKKREIRHYYNEVFKNLGNIETFKEPSYGKSSCWFSGIVLKNGTHETILNICDKLAQNNIEARSFWKPVYMQKPYKECLKSDMSITDWMWSKIITLPCSTNIGNYELKYIRDKLVNILEDSYECERRKKEQKA